MRVCRALECQAGPIPHLGNYGVTTTPTIEWLFVTEPEKPIQWPVEEKLRGSPDKMRKPLPLPELKAKVASVNERLDKMHEPRLLYEEAIGARLYSGPCFGLLHKSSPHTH